MCLISNTPRLNFFHLKLRLTRYHYCCYEKRRATCGRRSHYEPCGFTEYIINLNNIIGEASHTHTHETLFCCIFVFVFFLFRDRIVLYCYYYFFLFYVQINCAGAEIEIIYIYVYFKWIADRNISTERNFSPEFLASKDYNIINFFLTSAFHNNNLFRRRLVFRHLRWLFFSVFISFIFNTLHSTLYAARDEETTWR